MAFVIGQLPPNFGKGRNYQWLVDRIDHDGDACLIWPFSTNGMGYGTLGYRGRMSYAHRLMCEMVNGAPPTPGHEAAHSCGNGRHGCIHPRHLSWKTRSANQLDRRRHGTAVTSKFGASGKLSRAERAEIRSLRGHYTQAVMAKTYGVSVETISRILRTDPDRPLRRRPFDPTEDRFLRENLERGVSMIADHLGRTEMSIYSRIRRLRLQGPINADGAA
jgi:hypothetical protein